MMVIELVPAGFVTTSLTYTAAIVASIFGLCKVASLQSLDRNKGEFEEFVFVKLSMAVADEHKVTVVSTS
jgi:hypothetical protein